MSKAGGYCPAFPPLFTVDFKKALLFAVLRSRSRMSSVIASVSSCCRFFAAPHQTFATPHHKIGCLNILCGRAVDRGPHPLRLDRPAHFGDLFRPFVE